MIGDPSSAIAKTRCACCARCGFAASRGLEIDEATREPIKSLAPLLANVPPARLFDEMLKLLLSGHAYECVMALRKEGLHHGLLPMLDVILEQPLGERFVMLALRNTDARIKSDKPVSPSFLFASLLWHEVLAAWKKLEGEGVPPMPALYQAMDEVAAVAGRRSSRSRGATARDMKEIWVMQPRFLQRSGRRPYRLLEHPRFRAGYDFLLLRCASGEVDPASRRMVDALPACRRGRAQALLAQDRATEPAKRKRRRRRAARAAAPIAAAARAGADLSLVPAYVALGSNLRRSRSAGASRLRGACDAAATRGSRAVVALSQRAGRLSSISPISSTPWRRSRRRSRPRALLDALLAIERRYGRVREFPERAAHAGPRHRALWRHGCATSPASRSAPAHARARFRARAARRNRARCDRSRAAAA